MSFGTGRCSTSGAVPNSGIVCLFLDEYFPAQINQGALPLNRLGFCKSAVLGKYGTRKSW